MPPGAAEFCVGALPRVCAIAACEPLRLRTVIRPALLEWQRLAPPTPWLTPPISPPPPSPAAGGWVSPVLLGDGT